MNLLIDPARLYDIRADLGALINRHGATETAFDCHSGDEASGPRCGRCNRLLRHHMWQLVDGNNVIDCEVAS